MLAAGRATEVGGEFSHAVLLHSLRIIGHRFWAPGVARGRTVRAPVSAQDLTRRHRVKHYPARLEVDVTPDYRKLSATTHRGTGPAARMRGLYGWPNTMTFASLPPSA